MVNPRDIAGNAEEEHPFTIRSLRWSVEVLKDAKCYLLHEFSLSLLFVLNITPGRKQHAHPSILQVRNQVCLLLLHTL